MKLSKNTKIVIMVVAILLGLLLAVYILNQPIHASIYDYLPFIVGSTSLLTGLYLFLFAFRIYKPKYKTEEQQAKVADLLERRGKSWKFSSIFLILYGAFVLIRHDPDMFRLNSTIENNKWTDQDKTALIKNCMKGAVIASKKYPKITLDYCTCAIDKIIHTVGRKEYIEKPSDEEYKIDSPLIQGCVITFSLRVDSVKNKENNIHSFAPWCKNGRQGLNTLNAIHFRSLDREEGEG